MLHQIGLAAALGVGGFDPIGAVALVAAVVAGATKKSIIAFTAGAVGIGLVSGMLMAMGLGFVLDDISQALERVTGAPWRHYLYGGIALLASVVLVGWGVHLRRVGVKLSSFRKSFQNLGVKSMLISGVVIGAGVMTNPPFYLMLVLAGTPDNLLITFAHVVAFVLVAQSGMVVPTIALLLGLFDKLEHWLSRIGSRVVPRIERAAPWIVIVLGAAVMGFGLAELLGIVEL